MKHLKLTLLALFAFTLVQAQISTPQPSPAGSVSSQVGLTDVSISYFRPKVNGRKIFGEGNDFLQPYGQIWRTGANGGSRIKFSTDVTIGGKVVKAGEYLIFSIPGADEWAVMLYSDLSLGGNVNGYNTEKEVVRVNVKPTRLATPVETLTFNIADISADNTQASIELAWADVSVKVPMSVSFEEAVMKDIAAKTQVNPMNYIQAANFYYNYNKDLNQALTWVNQYLAIGENNKQFWNVHLKAQILAKMGKTTEAIAAATESMNTAKANPNGDFGYVKRNEDLIASLKKK